MPVQLPNNENNTPAVSTEVAAAVAVQAPELIPIELKGCQRFVIGGVLYEAGVVYEVEEKQAKALLRVRSDGDKGHPMFVRYEGDLDELPPQEPAPRPQVVRAPAPTKETDAPVVADSGKPTRIEVGDDAELAKDGILPDVDKGEAKEL